MKTYSKRSYIWRRWSVGDVVLVEVLGEVAHFAPERGRDGEGGREEPDQRDVDGVRPGSVEGSEIVGSRSYLYLLMKL